MAPKDAAGEWQGTYGKINRRVKHILESGDWSDCCFQFGVENPTLIKAHKLILAMASSVFGAMFYGGLAEKDRIAIVDIRPEIFTILLRYIYTDEIKIASFDVACDLYYAAKKYMMPHLAKECILYISSKLTPKNACLIYELACLFDELELMKMSLQVISSRTLEVLREPSFIEAEFKTVKKIVTMDRLNINSELDLITAVSRYANVLKRKTTANLKINIENMKTEVNNCEQEKYINNQADVPGNNYKETTEPGSSNSTKAPLNRPCSSKEIRSDNESDIVSLKVRSLLKHMRFLTLKPKELADSPFLSSLLTSADLFAIGMNMASSQTYVPMPAYLSSSRVPRYQIKKRVRELWQPPQRTIARPK